MGFGVGQKRPTSKVDMELSEKKKKKTKQNEKEKRRRKANGNRYDTNTPYQTTHGQI